MIWQNPLAWLGLLTLVLPILVHLFSRRQTRVESFPSLRFIDVSRLLPTRRTQLSDVPLLLVRLLLLTLAVAALTQPLWRSRNTSASQTDAHATAIVIDTVAVRGDSAVRSAIAGATTESAQSGGTQMRIPTANAREALAGAAAWLATQAGSRRLIVLANFAGHTLDSVDIATLPRDIAVTLVNAPSPAQAKLSTAGAVVWATDKADPANQPSHDAERSAVMRTVRALGAQTLADTPPATSVDSTTPSVVVADRDADSLAAWLRAARPLSHVWMGELLVRVSGDTTLVTAAQNERLTDTTVAAPWVAIARTRSGAPVVLAAALNDNANTARLVLWSRTTSTSLATAALLLSSSQALEPARHSQLGAAPDSATLRRWELAPAAPASANGDIATTDAMSGPSHARWLWIAVLLLLGVETWLRRRASQAQANLLSATETSRG